MNSRNNYHKEINLRIKPKTGYSATENLQVQVIFKKIKNATIQGFSKTGYSIRMQNVAYVKRGQKTTVSLRKDIPTMNFWS